MNEDGQLSGSPTSGVASGEPIRLRGARTLVADLADWVRSLAGNVAATLIVAGLLTIGGVLLALATSTLTVEEPVLANPGDSAVVQREGEEFVVEYEGTDVLYLIVEDPAGDHYPRGRLRFFDGRAEGSLGVIGGCFDFHNDATFTLRVVSFDRSLTDGEDAFVAMRTEALGPFEDSGFGDLKSHLVDRAQATVTRKAC